MDAGNAPDLLKAVFGEGFGGGELGEPGVGGERLEQQRQAVGVCGGVLQLQGEGGLPQAQWLEIQP